MTTSRHDPSSTHVECLPPTRPGIKVSGFAFAVFTMLSSPALLAQAKGSELPDVFDKSNKQQVASFRYG